MSDLRGIATADREVYLTAVRAAAFETDDGRTVVHSMAGYIGADWDLDAVLDAVREAQSVEFGPDIFDHCLRVIQPDGGLIRFEVPMPG